MCQIGGVWLVRCFHCESSKIANHHLYLAFVVGLVVLWELVEML